MMSLMVIMMMVMTMMMTMMMAMMMTMMLMMVMTMMMMMMMPLCNLPAAADFVVRGLAGPTSCCLRHHHVAQGGDRYHQRYDDHGEGKGRCQKKKERP